MKKGKKRKTPVKLFQTKRIISFILSMLMVFGNVANNASIVYAAEAVQGLKRTPDSIFLLDRDELQEAALAAIEDGEAFDPSVLLFTEGTKSSLSSKYKKLFGGSGSSVYEFDSNYSGDKIADGTDLRTFVRVDGNKKEIIFLLTNYSIEDMNFQINVNGYVSDVITVESATERVAGEADIIDKEETQPVETEPEADLPEETTESQPQGPGETSAEESTQPSETTEEVQAPDTEETSAAEETSSEAETTETVTEPETTAEETTAEEASTEETTTAASVPEETSEEITEEETSIEMPEEITTEETTEAVEEPDDANEPEDAAASLEDNVAQEAEGDMVAMSRHNVPRVATSLEGMSEAAEENTDAAEESQKQEPAVTEPAITEPAITEPAATEPAVTEPAATEPEITESSAEIPEETTGAADPTEAPTEPETETIITIDDPKTTEPEETTAPSEELIDEDIIDADIISDEITDEDTAAVYGSLKGGKVYGLVELDETYTARAFVISLDRLMEQTASEEELLPEEVLIPETPAVLEPAEDTVIEAEVTGGDVSIRIEIPADLGIDVDHAVAEPVDTEPLWPVVEAAGPEEMQLQDMKAYDIMLYDGDGNEIHELDGRVNVIFDGLDAELTDSEEVNVYYLQTPAVSRFKSSAGMSGYNLTQMQDSGIDGEGSVSFRTDHFSTYIVTFWNIGSKDVKLNLITKDVQTGGQIGNEIDRNFEDFYRGSGARVSTEELADKVMDEDEMLENYDYKGTLLSGTYSEDSRRVAEIYVSYRGNIEYRFSGETKWRELSGVNLYLWFEKQQTKITFHSNNGEKDTYKLGVEGDTITMPDLQTTGFENGGRQFLGWSSDRSGQAQLLQPGETIQSASASNDYYAVWSYMATFKANGGTGNDHYVQANQDGSVVMPKLDETGFENGRRQFLGWSLSSGSRSDLLQSGASVNLERDTVYYAVWTYEAVFNANGGRGDDFYLAENSDGKFIMPDQQAVGFTNGEKTLIGWSKSRTDRADLFLPGQEVKASDSKYYAVWSYNVIFNANTGSGSKTFEKAMENGKLVMPSQEETSFTNGDRALLGWSLRPTNRDNVILPGAVISVNNDTTYYAVWSYQATFYPNKNEGGYLEDEKLAHVIPISSNGTVELPSAAAIGLKNRNEKKVFAGWVVGSASATDVFGPEITYSGLKKDTYFYARWIDTEAEGSVKAQYYVRKDGVIQAEPSQYEEKDYFPKAPGMAGTIKVAMRVNNDFDAVEANLGRVPTDATIQAAASKAGYSFDPETQYVRWYVIKVSSGTWHVDGVIQEKSKYSVIYHPNKGTDYFPDIVQYTAGENVTVDYSKLPVRDGYEFAGWDRDPDSSYPEYPMPKGSERAPEFVMPEYDVDLYAIWKPSNNTRITVEHYWQKADADQAVSETDFEYYESKPAYGTTGETVYDADYKMDYQGFTYQEGIVDGRSSETVEADGTTVLKLYYTRNQNTKYLVEHYVQDLNADTYSFKESTEGSGITGRAAEYVPNAYPGFEYNENATKFYSRKGSNDSEVNSSAILADGSLVIKLYYTRRNNIGYTVEYYYQENGKYPDTANYYDQSRSGGFGETVSVTAADKIPVMDKYVYDENAANITSGTISEDGLILKLYFKQTFTVTYKPGIYGTFENDIHRNVPYGDATPEFGGTLEGRPGYRFERWDPAVEPAVEHDAVYTAIWSPESTKYHVEYYYQNQGTYSHTADDKSDDRFALTDTSVKVTDEDLVPAKAGYVFDEHADSLNILEGTVAGDGSLVLKVYFKQQFTVTYEPGTQGTFTAETTENLDYNAVTPEFKGNTTGNTGYTFIGWLPEIADTVTEDAVYVAQWAANEDTEYKVEYYYETAGTYRDTADDYTMNRGTTDTLAEVTSSDKIPSKEGYVYDGEAGNVLSGIIKGDGSLVLKVYFKQQFTVTYEPGTQGTFTAETTENLDYNAVTPEFKGNTTGNAGYTFIGWLPEVADTVTEDAVYVAQWAANEDTEYKVEYYYETAGTYRDTADDYTTNRGTTDTLAEVTSSDKTPSKEGYVYDGEAGNVLSGMIKGDGSLVLKVYFKQQFTVTYEPGTQGTFTAETTENLDYNAVTPEFKGNITGNAGYTFIGWLPKVADTVTEDAVYTAQWAANEDTEYKVEYYYETAGTYRDAADDYTTKRGITDTLAEVTSSDKTPSKEGYVYDGEAGNVLSGIIKGDGSLVLKVYFKQQFTVTYEPGTQGTFTAETTENLDYNAVTPEFKGNTTGNAGYTFIGWLPEIADTVTEDAVYTAQWAANEDTEYKVEYYYETAGAYRDTADDYTTNRGTTDTLAEVTSSDKTPSKEGYVYDGEAGNVLSGMIKGDGSLVLKVYFKQQFTVIYEPGTQGTFTAETTENLDYNAATPEFKGDTTGNAGYTFIGWLPEVAGTVTEDAVYTAQWAANEDTEYKVEYYYETAGTYRDTADDYTTNRGTTDTLAEVTSSDKTPSKEGYVYDGEAGNVLSGMIKGDGSLVLKVYFKQQFTVTYEPGIQGTFTAETTENLDYNAATPEFKGNTTGNAGYTFIGWLPEVAGTVTEDAVYVAQWAANDDTEYRIEYYYENAGTYSGTTGEYTIKRGTTDTLAEATAADKTPLRSGYVYDGEAGNVLTGMIKGDGSLVLKVYFKQQFTVKYQPGTHGTFTEQTYASLGYGDATPGFNGQITGAAGYEFGGWTPAVTSEVTQDAVYVATWNTKDSTKYTVEFYYQSQGAYPAAASSTQVRSGRTDEKAVVTDADKTPAAGYLLDTAAANVYEGSIAGDGSLVLRLYFKQQFTVTYEPGTRGTFAVQIHNGLSYHDKTPSFNGNTTGSGRYVFNGWDPVVADTVTGNVTYVAQWRYVGTSGGGGGNSGGGPNYNASGSSDGPGATVTVLPTEVPLANAPDTNNMIVIDDGLVPLAALPKTGDRSGASGWMLILSGLLLSAYTIVTKKKEEEN